MLSWYKGLNNRAGGPWQRYSLSVPFLNLMFFMDHILKVVSIKLLVFFVFVFFYNAAAN